MEYVKNKVFPLSFLLDQKSRLRLVVCIVKILEVGIMVILHTDKDLLKVAEFMKAIDK
jgi:hypothetical protein